MEIIESPKIRFHISFNESLTLKDFEDLIYLIRTSNNEALNKMGISKQKGNSIQKIEEIRPGSIDLVAVFDVLVDVVSMVSFILTVVNVINKKVKETKAKKENKNLTGHADTKAYEKCPIKVNHVCMDNEYGVDIHLENHNMQQNNKKDRLFIDDNNFFDK